MGFENRDYQRDDFGGGAGGGFGAGGRMAGASATMWLLGIIAGVFVLDSILGGARRAGGFTLSALGEFTVAEGVQGFQVWRFVTFQFLHGGLVHVFFNCLLLYFFGPLLERWWGSRRFVAFFLICGVTGGVLYTVMTLAMPTLIFPEMYVAAGNHLDTPLVGASGGLFGILVGAAVLFPNLRVVLLIPPIPMTMRTIAMVVLGIAVLTILLGGANAGGQAAHLGGAAMGYVLLTRPNWLNWADAIGPGGGRSRGGGLGSVVEKAKQAQQQRESRRHQQEDAEVDRILAKVRDQGLQSLTKAEQRTLQRATERQRGGR